MAIFKYFILPADFCTESIELFSRAKEEALAAKKTWSLEKSLGVHGFIFGRLNGVLGFWYSKAQSLPDGRAVIDLPVRDQQGSPSANRDKDPGVPGCAIEISYEEANALKALAPISKEAADADTSSPRPRGG